jgi:hypothetical protein
LPKNGGRVGWHSETILQEPATAGEIWGEPAPNLTYSCE